MSLDPETDFYGEYVIDTLRDEVATARAWARAWKALCYQKESETVFTVALIGRVLKSGHVEVAQEMIDLITSQSPDALGPVEVV